MEVEGRYVAVFPVRIECHLLEEPIKVVAANRVRGEEISIEEGDRLPQQKFDLPGGADEVSELGRGGVGVMTKKVFECATGDIVRRECYAKCPGVLVPVLPRQTIPELNHG